MTRYSHPYNLSQSDIELSNIYLVLRKNKICFSKAKAAEFVGGRRALERLVADQRIRMVRSGSIKNATWQCNGEDVLRIAQEIYQENLNN